MESLPDGVVRQLRDRSQIDYLDHVLSGAVSSLDARRDLNSAVRFAYFCRMAARERPDDGLAQVAARAAELAVDEARVMWAESMRTAS